MNFGFDIDGTISAAPEVYAHLIEAIHKRGDAVFILTGTMAPVVTVDDYIDRVLQLQSFGITPGTYVLFIVNAPNHVANKARICKLFNIRMMFEDSDAYAAAINAAGTLCVKMP